MTMYQVNPGKYKHIVTFQRVIENRNSYGEIIRGDETNWEDYFQTRAGIFPLSGREFFTARMSESEITHKIQVRYNPETPIDSTMRIKFGNRIFDIISPPINYQEKNVEYNILCKEREDLVNG